MKHSSYLYFIRMRFRCDGLLCSGAFTDMTGD